MTIIKENIGVIYDTPSGVVAKKIQVAKRDKIVDLYELKPGQAFLIGKRPDKGGRYKVENGEFVLLPPIGLTAEQLSRAAKEDVDRIAGVLRGEIGSAGYGQEMTYLAKEAEARAYQTATTPVDADYPMILAEVGITGPAMSDVSSTVIAMANSWKQLAGAIEAVRLGTKKSIAAATTAEEIETIMQAVVWPS